MSYKKWCKDKLVEFLVLNQIFNSFPLLQKNSVFSFLVIGRCTLKVLHPIGKSLTDFFEYKSKLI